MFLTKLNLVNPYFLQLLSLHHTITHFSSALNYAHLAYMLFICCACGWKYT